MKTTLEESRAAWQALAEKETIPDMKQTMRRTSLALCVQIKTGVAVTSCCLMPFDKALHDGKCKGTGNRDNGHYTCSTHEALKIINA